MPQLGENGFLSPGVHDMSLAEIHDLFGTFQDSDRRPRLFETLRAFIEAARPVRAIDHIVIDGSFVTATAEPGDIDIIIAIVPEAFATQVLLPRDYKMLSSRRIRQTYKFDALVAPVGSDAYAEYLDFFSRVKGAPDHRKGVVRLKVNDQD